VNIHRPVFRRQSSCSQSKAHSHQKTWLLFCRVGSGRVIRVVKPKTWLNYDWFLSIFRSRLRPAGRDSVLIKYRRVIYLFTILALFITADICRFKKTSILIVFAIRFICWNRTEMRCIGIFRPMYWIMFVPSWKTTNNCVSSICIWWAMIKAFIHWSGRELPTYNGMWSLSGRQLCRHDRKKIRRVIMTWSTNPLTNSFLLLYDLLLMSYILLVLLSKINQNILLLVSSIHFLCNGANKQWREQTFSDIITK